ncbi:MAG: hypothetical protein OIF48_08395 [Silicimonas sp.]|nr:hypothetical protein [Silicimonas sp.]
MKRALSGLFRSRVALAALLSTLLAVTNLRAHEVQPAVMDIEFQGNTLQIHLDWMLEAPLAGIDLEGLANTNASEGEEDYLRLRNLPPAEMDAATRAAWPGLADKISIMAGDDRLTPELTRLDIPGVGNVELARLSTLTLAVPLPASARAITIGWTPDLGALIVRQRSVENGYAAFLAPGQSTAQIPRPGGTNLILLAGIAVVLLGVALFLARLAKARRRSRARP